ncbi:DUF930 domain-containing protein [Allomesorhizobium camelthorni]|uniref:DUF930 domain-containing protein n=1 Tax=Allomesorhizobium camelthorni TaxID=475069 RepID=UPI0031B6302E
MPASLILHALIIALLVYGLPTTPPPPQEEQAVNVSLVPPPDRPKPKPAPVPSPREAKAEKPPERKVEKPPPPEKQPREPSPIEVLKPVFRFGDKDTGPRKSLDGGSAQDNSPPRAGDDDSKPSVAPKDAEDEFTAPADAEEQADATKDAEPAQDVEKQATATQEADKHEAVAHDADKQTAAALTVPAAAGSNGEIELPTSVEAPKPRPANASKPRSARRPGSTDVAVATSQGVSGLPGVRRLYSQGATGDALATTSMDGVPRDKRAAKLCASALQQQLLDASYFPDLVPLVLLKAGNILDVPEAAFHTGTTWYGLSFRCEVDTDATRVLSFDFHVGPAIPRGEWARLGLPIRY